MTKKLAALLALTCLTATADAKPKAVRGVAQAGTLILYSEPNFNGEAYEFAKARVQLPMEWPVRSIAVAPGEAWEVCEKPRYKGACITVDKSHAQAGEAGVTGMVASLRVAGKAAVAEPVGAK